MEEGSEKNEVSVRASREKQHTEEPLFVGLSPKVGRELPEGIGIDTTFGQARE